MEYCDILCSEYSWSRRYVLWLLPFAVGVKHIAMITARLTGKDLLEENRNSRMLNELAELAESEEASDG